MKPPTYFTHSVLLYLVCAAGIWCTPCRADSHSAVKPAPRGDQSWKERAKLLDDRVRETQDAQILFIGDSITHGWEGSGKEIWAKFYSPRKAINLGIGGDRTQHVLWRLQNAPWDSMSPKAAVIMIGTNNSNGEDNTPGQIADGVAAIVKHLRSRLPNTKVLVLAIFPRGENFNPQRGKIAQVNQVLQKLDDGKNVFFMDIGHRFLHSDGILLGEIMPDFLHLSPQGYQIWAEAIEPKLQELLGNKETTQIDVSGDWIWRTMGPNGEEVEGPLTLVMENGTLVGTFQSQEEERQIKIQKGSLTGKQITLTARRPRRQGGEAVYVVTGVVEGDRIKGQVTGTIEGEQHTQDWSARRK